MLGVVLGKLCVSIIFPSEMLAAQVLVCLPIGWVDVLEVLRMLDAQVLCYTHYAIPSFRQVGHTGTCVPAYWLG